VHRWRRDHDGRHRGGLGDGPHRRQRPEPVRPRDEGATGHPSRSPRSARSRDPKPGAESRRGDLRSSDPSLARLHPPHAPEAPVSDQAPAGRGSRALGPWRTGVWSWSGAPSARREGGGCPPARPRWAGPLRRPAGQGDLARSGGRP
jgi:hypothetical protein